MEQFKIMDIQEIKNQVSELLNEKPIVLVAEEPPTPEKDKWWLNKVRLFIAKIK